MELSGNFDRIIDVIDNDDPAEQRLRHIPVFFIDFYQFVRHADDALFFQGIRIPKFLRIFNARER